MLTLFNVQAIAMVEGEMPNSAQSCLKGASKFKFSLKFGCKNRGLFFRKSSLPKVEGSGGVVEKIPRPKGENGIKLTPSSWQV